MFPQFRYALCIVAGAAVLASATQTSAQWMNSNACGCAAPPMVRTPVVQKCYQQVAVTEYQQVKQTVRRPVTEVEYVDQPVTTYRPVTETRTVDVPVTTYQTVNECRTVTRNAGYWKTNYYNRCKKTACQYDPRQTVAGWFNRTAYRMRSSFTPNVVSTRQYVPQTIAQQVPVSRRIPITTVQKRSYQVTKYVPQTTTRKVAVNKVRWVNQEVVALKPVTVMKTIPTTRTAWTWSQYGTPSVGNTAISYGQPTSTIALKPEVDPLTTKRARVSTRTKDDEATDDRGDINRVDTSSIQRTKLQPIPESIPTRTEPRTVAVKKSLFVGVPARSARTTGLARVGGWRSTTKKRNTVPMLLPVNTAVAAISE
jgi:hypothetical protein